MLARALCLIALLTAMAVPAPAAEQSLGGKIKKIFSTPTPTPGPRKKRSSTKKASPSPSASPKETSSPATEAESPAPSAPASAKKTNASSPENESEPSKNSAKNKKAPASASPSAITRRKKKSSPTPEAQETPSKSTSPSAGPENSPGIAPESPSPVASKKHGAPNATLAPEAIKGFEDYPANVQKLLASALELTTRDLGYTYGSADPANGGMDCSGFVYFVLKQNGVTDVPRDSSEQYVWLRRARKFEAVLSQKEDSFELQDLRPGDLLFWTGTYSIERDPPITHAMIFLGREKKTGQRVMVGASDGRIYQGQSRNGVSVFDFKIQPNGRMDEGKLRPTFVGYGHIPGF